MFLTCFSRVPDSGSRTSKPLNYREKSRNPEPKRSRIIKKVGKTREFRLNAETGSHETASTANYSILLNNNNVLIFKLTAYIQSYLQKEGRLERFRAYNAAMPATPAVVILPPNPPSDPLVVMEHELVGLAVEYGILPCNHLLSGRQIRTINGYSGL